MKSDADKSWECWDAFGFHPLLVSKDGGGYLFERFNRFGLTPYFGKITSRAKRF